MHFHPIDRLCAMDLVSVVLLEICSDSGYPGYHEATFGWQNPPILHQVWRVGGLCLLHLLCRPLVGADGPGPQGARLLRQLCFGPLGV